MPHWPPRRWLSGDGAATDTVTVSWGVKVVVTARGVPTVAVPFSVAALLSMTTIVSPAPSPSTALVGITMVPVVCPLVSMVNDSAHVVRVVHVGGRRAAYRYNRPTTFSGARVAVQRHQV